MNKQRFYMFKNMCIYLIYTWRNIALDWDSNMEFRSLTQQDNHEGKERCIVQ